MAEIHAYSPSYSTKTLQDSIFKNTDSLNKEYSNYWVNRDSFAVKLRKLKDSTVVSENPSLIVLLDTFLAALRNNEPGNILKFTPEFEVFLKYIDSSEASKYSDLSNVYKHKNIKMRLSKQYKRIKKEAKNWGFSLRNSEVKHFFMEYGHAREYENKPYCYLNIEMTRGKNIIRVRILALEMDGLWYFMDELSLLVVKKVKEEKRSRVR
jgi:hypothetical protein